MVLKREAHNDHLHAATSRFRKYAYGQRYIYVWQSQVEIEHYFIAYFDHVIAFEAL